MADRFATTLDCVDTGFLPDGVLDELPLPSQIGAVRIAGVDLNKPGSAPPWPRHSPWPRPPTGSPSPSSPPRSAR